MRVAPAYHSLRTLLTSLTESAPSSCQTGIFQEWMAGDNLGIQTYYQYPTKVTPGISCSNYKQETTNEMDRLPQWYNRIASQRQPCWTAQLQW